MHSLGFLHPPIGDNEAIRLPIEFSDEPRRGASTLRFIHHPVALSTGQGPRICVARPVKNTASPLAAGARTDKPESDSAIVGSRSRNLDEHTRLRNPVFAWQADVLPTIPSLRISNDSYSQGRRDVLRIKHACIRAGISPRRVLKPENRDVESAEYSAAMEAVAKEMEWLASPKMSKLALFANTDYVDREKLNLWIRGGVEKYRTGAIIVDHIDQVDHGAGVNPVIEATATVQLLHDLAREYEIPIVIASQLKRQGDPLKRFAPPDEEDFAGTSGKERIASVMLGLWRPLRTDLGAKELRAVLRDSKQGSMPEDRIYQTDTMGVRLLKDRLGSVPGKQTMLHVGPGGRLADDPALTHGIHTGSGR